MSSIVFVLKICKARLVGLTVQKTDGPMRPWPSIHFGCVLWPHPPAKRKNYCSLNLPNFCDSCVKKLVSENLIRKFNKKMSSASENFSTLTPWRRHAHRLAVSPCSLNFPNLCDNFVKKLVCERGKCSQLLGDKVSLC